MPHPRSVALAEAERQLKMNLSLLEMLKKNTTDEQIACLRKLWVKPCEEKLRDLQAPDGPDH